MTKLLKVTDYTDIVWNGDISWDPIRKSGFPKVMKTFLEKTELKSVWDTYPIDFTHIHTDVRSTAILDHFLVSARLISLINECKVLHRGDNLSRHSPILLKLRVGDISEKKKVCIQETSLAEGHRRHDLVSTRLTYKTSWVTGYCLCQ